MMFQTFLCSFVLAAAAHAQPFSVGLKAGGSLTDAIQVGSAATFATVSVDNHHYVIGPYVELRLPLQLSLEVDALYRSYNFQLAPGTKSSSVGSWEFPVLAKYKLFKGPVRPYIDGGLVFSHLTGLANIPGVLHNSDYGVALGAGVEIHALVLRISPEIRYDGFVFKNFGDVIQSNRNQAMVMVGIEF
jgi:hypothetical protein